MTARDVTFVVTRYIGTDECPWLQEPIEAGTRLHRYPGCTYGCMGRNDTAFTREEGEEPFFALPNDAVEKMK